MVVSNVGDFCRCIRTHTHILMPRYAYGSLSKRSDDSHKILTAYLEDRRATLFVSKTFYAPKSTLVNVAFCLSAFQRYQGDNLSRWYDVLSHFFVEE